MELYGLLITFRQEQLAQQIRSKHRNQQLTNIRNRSIQTDIQNTHHQQTDYDQISYLISSKLNLNQSHQLSIFTDAQTRPTPPQTITQIDHQQQSDVGTTVGQARSPIKVSTRMVDGAPQARVRQQVISFVKNYLTKHKYDQIIKYVNKQVGK